MKYTVFAKSALGISVALASAGAMAIEAASIPVGGMKLTPTLTASEAYDTNIGKNQASVDSWVTTLAPRLSLVAEERLNAYMLEYGFVAERFHSAQNSDNIDHTLNGKAHMEFSSRSRLDLNLGYQVNEDTDVANDEDYKETSFGGVYGYGSEKAKMQLEFGANKQIKRYDYARFNGKEVDIRTLSAIAYYQVAPATKAVVEYRNSDYDYVSANAIDSNANTYLAGVTWDATAKTSGSAKIGHTAKDFDLAGKADPDSNIWEVSVTWSPRTYSNVTATYNQSLGEGSSTENYIDTDALTLNWNHQWSSFISTDVNYSNTDETYKGLANNGRKDDTVSYGVGVTYNLARNIDIGLGYSITDKDSTTAAEAYDRKLVAATLNIGF